MSETLSLPRLKRASALETEDVPSSITESKQDVRFHPELPPSFDRHVRALARIAPSPPSSPRFPSGYPSTNFFLFPLCTTVSQRGAFMRQRVCLWEVDPWQQQTARPTTFLRGLYMQRWCGAVRSVLGGYMHDLLHWLLSCQFPPHPSLIDISPSRPSVPPSLSDSFIQEYLYQYQLRFLSL